ncbi:hypothetical protein BH11CYA1_BH11CYA1_11310 [soil metagenome]
MIDLSATAPVMIVSFSVEADQAAEFDRFYHHQFLPKLLSISPEIKNIARYQADSPGAANTVAGQYLTVYELSGSDALKLTDQIFERTGFADELAQFKKWKEKALKNFSRTNYQAIYEHQRRAYGGHFGRCPMLFFSSEMKAQDADAFRQWYQLSYLPRLMADVPTFSGARRYAASANSNPEATTKDKAVQYITVMESVDELTLSHSIERMAVPHRSDENAGMQKWLDSAVSFTATNTFRPIFCLPE